MTREEDLMLALNVALGTLIQFEPGDSRAVSDEFVAMAAIACNLDDLDESRSILRNALEAQGTEARRAETENTGSVHDGPVAKPCAQNMSGPSHE